MTEKRKNKTKRFRYVRGGKQTLVCSRTVHSSTVAINYDQPMNQEQLRKEYLRLTRLETIKDCSDLLDIYLKYFFEVIKQNSNEAKTHAESEAELVNQMIFTKIGHMKELLNGFEYESADGTKLNRIVDPTVIASHIRNLFETVSMFSLVYTQPSTDDEKTILYNLWVSAGLKYRQRFDVVVKKAESQEKLDKEKQQIDDLKAEIENTDLYKALDEKDRNKIQSKLKEKDYKIQFKDGKVEFLSWQETVPVMGIRDGVMDTIYTYFSLYAHPSNVSVFQFADMFKKEENPFIYLTTFNLNNFFFLLSIFLFDYIKLFPNVKNTFEQLEKIEQIVIDRQNVFARDESYSINDEWKALG
ncbi:hypothetical protein [Maribacter sp. 6B07]|uniref:hypothetical protein n=1 Tax=Maribacter sp. 6B07 TaxID=2045442 RepID=UPI00117F10C8|nr:hypothetical protein [Maribacter sp. 6B07]